MSFTGYGHIGTMPPPSANPVSVMDIKPFTAVLRQARFDLSAPNLKHCPPEQGIEIAFAGRSNAGKSSALNSLADQKSLARTSKTPGRTQLINFFRINDDWKLVDLPGYGYARVSKKMQDQWQELIVSYLEGSENLRCVVVIVDLRHPAKLLDMQLVDWLREKSIPFLMVYTKADKLSKNQQIKMARSLDLEFRVTEAERILFSSQTGTGRDVLIRKLDQFVC